MINIRILTLVVISLILRTMKHSDTLKQCGIEREKRKIQAKCNIGGLIRDSMIQRRLRSRITPLSLLPMLMICNSIGQSSWMLRIRTSSKTRRISWIESPRESLVAFTIDFDPYNIDMNLLEFQEDPVRKYSPHITIHKFNASFFKKQKFHKSVLLNLKKNYIHYGF